MIIAQSTSVPYSFRGFGDASNMTAEAVAVAQRADRIFRLAGELGGYPFLGREGRARAAQIQQAAETAHQDMQLAAAPVADVERRVAVLESQYEDLTRKARRNVILASVGMAAVVVGGGYTIWHWKRKRSR